MKHDTYSDAYIRDILVNYRSFALVGASPTLSRPSYFAMKYLMAKGFRVIPVNPAHAGKLLLGQKIHASLVDIEEPVEVVDIFRNSEAALPITREAIAMWS
jgi:predicted CoA-binding protein